MISLDDQEKIEEYDKGKIVSTIRLYADQIEQAWEDISSLSIDKDYSEVDNVVICGMGGSALGGRIIDSYLTSRVRVPIEVFTEYDIPNYVNNKTLIILSSYSGNTEETINAYHEAKNKNAKTFIITTGGALRDEINKGGLGYLILPKANPSGQPRMGTGYSIFSILSLLSKLKLIELSKDEVFEIAVKIRSFVSSLDINKKSSENLAKKYALKFLNKIPVIVSSEHLYGVTHATKNQINENAKNFAVLFDLPELNHHLMEGLKHPRGSRELLKFLMYKSKLYRKELLKRYDVTKEVIERNGYEVEIFIPFSENKLHQTFEVLIFGSFLSFYLAYLNNEDASQIPWVDYFKAKLAKT